MPWFMNVPLPKCKSQKRIFVGKDVKKWWEHGIKLVEGSNRGLLVGRYATTATEMVVLLMKVCHLKQNFNIYFTRFINALKQRFPTAFHTRTTTKKWEGIFIKISSEHFYKRLKIWRTPWIFQVPHVGNRCYKVKRALGQQ